MIVIVLLNLKVPSIQCLVLVAMIVVVGGRMSQLSKLIDTIFRSQQAIDAFKKWRDDEDV